MCRKEKQTDIQTDGLIDGGIEEVSHRYSHNAIHPLLVITVKRLRPQGTACPIILVIANNVQEISDLN